MFNSLEDIKIGDIVYFKKIFLVKDINSNMEGYILPSQKASIEFIEKDKEISILIVDREFVKGSFDDLDFVFTIAEFNEYLETFDQFMEREQKCSERIEKLLYDLNIPDLTNTNM